MAGLAGLGGSLAVHAGLFLVLLLAALAVGSGQKPPVVVQTVTLISGDALTGRLSFLGGQTTAGGHPSPPQMSQVTSPTPRTPVRQESVPVELAEAGLSAAVEPPREKHAARQPLQKSQPRPARQSSTPIQVSRRVSQTPPDQAYTGNGPVDFPSGQLEQDQREGHGADRGPGRNEGVFGEGNGPRFARRVLPVYPTQARRQGKEGVVLLRLTLDAAGVLQGVEVLQSAGQLFDEEAVQALKASSYHPATRGSRAVPCTATIRIRFNLTS